MKAFALMVIVGLTLGFTSLAMAKEHGSKPAGPKPLAGTIVRVDGTNVIVTTGKKDAQVEKTVKTDDKTVVTVNHAPAKLTDLAAGQHVKISGADPGPATEIAVVSKGGSDKHEKHEKKK